MTRRIVRRVSAGAIARLLIAVAAAAAAGCPAKTPAPVQDAGNDGLSSDGPAPLTLNIAITGCDNYTAAVPPALPECSGPAPLALSFSPVGSQQFSRFTWTFGDGTATVTDRAPMHTFGLPGSYQVDLVGAFGTANFVKTSAMIVVEPVGAGAFCDVDAQCRDGLACACAPGAGCAPAFSHGICTGPCDGDDGGTCDPGATCALAALGPATDAGAPAPQAWCLAGCPGGSGCASGFSCAALPAAGPAGGGSWTWGCLPVGALRNLGASCRNADGVLDPTQCSTGQCADLGALGLCSAACDDAHPCPGGAACAQLGDGQALCLVDCAAAPGGCASDPLLACAPPASADAGTGFQASADAGATFCAPRSCATDGDCAPSGRCGPGAACLRITGGD